VAIHTCSNTVHKPRRIKLSSHAQICVFRGRIRLPQEQNEFRVIRAQRIDAHDTGALC
jgi:hypothetical protein